MAIPIYLFVLLLCLMFMFIGLAMFYSKKKTDQILHNNDKMKIKDK